MKIFTSVYLYSHFTLVWSFLPSCEFQRLPSLPLYTTTDVCRNKCFVYNTYYMRQGSVCLSLTLTSQLTIAVHTNRSPGSQVQLWQLVSCQFWLCCEHIIRKGLLPLLRSTDKETDFHGASVWPHHSPSQIPQWHCSAQTVLETKIQWSKKMCFWALSPLPCLFTYPHFNKSRPLLLSLAFVPLSAQQCFFSQEGPSPASCSGFHSAISKDIAEASPIKDSLRVSVSGCQPHPSSLKRMQVKTLEAHF